MRFHRRTPVILTILTALVMSAVAALPAPSNPIVEMAVAGRGTVRIELFRKQAPKTVAHFLGLVKSKFYDGILFHRVRPGFVAQAGDPASKKYRPADFVGKTEEQVGLMGVGGGGSGPGGKNSSVPFEENRFAHEPGTLALALNAPHSDTGDSQFFINLAPNHGLDGDYCVFGKVAKGFDVVKKIKQGDRITAIKLVKK
jgi:peptidyl-prolyl cis-trans isomerase B (cyclophilin B)